jgi:very-short-patch-repair endonuclease
MGIRGNLRDEYKPARIYNAVAPNANHIPQPKFSDQDLGKPEPPSTPTQQSVNKAWLPIGETVALLIALVFLQAVPLLATLASLAIPIVWLWALLKKLPEYEKEKGKADREYQEALQLYQKEMDHYDVVLLPEWQEKIMPQVLAKKQQEWASQNLNIENACRLKNWHIHSEREIQETRYQGYIGPGEDEVVQILSDTVLQVCHQVRIEDYYTAEDHYTADIVCFYPASGKLCVVEIDGSQHWTDEDQIDRDNYRMKNLARKGVPTIRFINRFAKDCPTVCVKYIRQLLSENPEQSIDDIETISVELPTSRSLGASHFVDTTNKLAQTPINKSEIENSLEDATNQIRKPSKNSRRNKNKKMRKKLQGKEHIDLDEQPL